MNKKTESINMLIQWAFEIITNGLVLIDDHINASRTIDHLVILECGDNDLYLCPVIDSTICCCLNAVSKEDDGYHLTYLNVWGNVWNKDPRKNISDRCADYNAAESKNDDKIIRVIC